MKVELVDLVDCVEDISQDITSEDTKPRSRPSYEDLLYIFACALRNNIIGKVAPAQRKGWGARTEYALLVNETNAAALLNSVSDYPVTVDNLKAALRKFGRSDPPYRSRI